MSFKTHNRDGAKALRAKKVSPARFQRAQRAKRFKLKFHHP